MRDSLYKGLMKKCQMKGQQTEISTDSHLAFESAENQALDQKQEWKDLLQKCIIWL